MSQTPTNNGCIEVDPIVSLRVFIATVGTQRQAAVVLSVPESYLSNMLKGVRPVPPKVLAHLGLRRAVIALPSTPVDDKGGQ